MQPLWKTVCQFLKNENITLTFNPDISVLDIDPESENIPTQKLVQGCS
jgi:hypothetical protein